MPTDRKCAGCNRPVATDADNARYQDFVEAHRRTPTWGDELCWNEGECDPEGGWPAALERERERAEKAEALVAALDSENDAIRLQREVAEAEAARLRARVERLEGALADFKTCPGCMGNRQREDMITRTMIDCSDCGGTGETPWVRRALAGEAENG